MAQRKNKKYDIKFKLSVVKYAEENSGEAAARYFSVHPKRVVFPLMRQTLGAVHEPAGLFAVSKTLYWAQTVVTVLQHHSRSKASLSANTYITPKHAARTCTGQPSLPLLHQSPASTLTDIPCLPMIGREKAGDRLTPLQYTSPLYQVATVRTKPETHIFKHKKTIVGIKGISVW